MSLASRRPQPNMRTYPINLANIAQSSVRDGKLQAALDALPHHQDVHIIGGGPSANLFNPDDHPDAFIILLNKAVELFRDIGHMHVMVEDTVWLFDWAVQDPAFRGLTVMAEACAVKAPADAYGAGFWNKVLWTRRTSWKRQDLSTVGKGLIQIAGFGGVALNAIHIAHILEARSYHTWGIELWFPHGQQHFDGATPYSDGPLRESMVKFDIIDGRAISGGGPFESTNFFIGTSQAIRKVCKHEGITLVDHAPVGLLNPESLIPLREEYQ